MTRGLDGEVRRARRPRAGAAGSESDLQEIDAPWLGTLVEPRGQGKAASGAWWAMQRAPDAGDLRYSWRTQGAVGRPWGSRSGLRARKTLFVCSYTSVSSNRSDPASPPVCTTPTLRRRAQGLSSSSASRANAPSTRSRQVPALGLAVLTWCPSSPARREDPARFGPEHRLGRVARPCSTLCTDLNGGRMLSALTLLGTCSVAGSLLRRRSGQRGTPGSLVPRA